MTTTAKRTTEEVQALALERINSTFQAAYFDLIGPLLKGLDIEADQDVVDEIARIAKELESQSIANPTPTMIWKAMMGTGEIYPWFSVIDGMIYHTPGTITVTAEDPNGGSDITKSFTALDLLHAYQSMTYKTHCGRCNLIGDPDSCTFDLIMQWAFFGEIVYG